MAMDIALRLFVAIDRTDVAGARADADRLAAVAS